jgi:3-phenylpropionate/trans-cinnamate dioxygenase ferredoxin reductase subunit
VSDAPTPPSGPDFARGFQLSDIPDGGMLGGHADGQPVLVSRRGTELHAIGALCTHYGGPLAEGLLVEETVRCPWHHACFDLRTGVPLRAPALKPLSRWKVEERGSHFYVTGEFPPSILASGQATTRATAAPASVVIVGAGAAGNAAAEMLRRQGYAGPVTLIGAEDSPPCDRPNLSKDYLAGTAPEDWIPLRSPDFYGAQEIRLLTGRQVTSIDTRRKRVILDDGSKHEFGALLLATGADPIHLPTVGSSGSDVHYLRTLADSRAIIMAARGARRAVVIGGSFIGLEVAASLRARGLEVHVVAPEARPLERVLGPELGDFIRGIHEAHGVTFHLGQSASRIDFAAVTLGNGERISADLVVAGIGVRPNEHLAVAAGLAVDRGIVVDEFLETATPGIFAAGDVARYPDPRTGTRIRVEHWVVAERQGQVAARNILGARERFTSVPFFWSQHYDVQISYVGHAEHWDAVQISGNLAAQNCSVTFRDRGRRLAVATVGRDRESLEAELAMERER